MYHKDERNTEALTGLRNVQDKVLMTNFIKSIYIYNNYTKEYYSTDNGVFTDDKMFEDLISSHSAIPQMRLVPRKIPAVPSYGEEGSEYVFSYFMFETPEPKKSMDNCLILDIKPDWLFDNIRMLSGIDAKKDSRIFIITDNGSLS